MASRDLYRAEDDSTWIAVWTCTEGSFWSRYAGDEAIYLISGRVRVTDQDGRSATLPRRAGDPDPRRQPLHVGDRGGGAHTVPLPGRGRCGGGLVSRSADVVDRLKGPVVPVNICFADDPFGRLRGDAPLRRLAVRAAGCRSSFLTYGSSEFSVLSAEEIWEAHRAVRAPPVAGRALFVTSTGYWSIGECPGVPASRRCRGRRDAVKVQINPWLGQEREVLVGYFDAIHGAAGIPVLVWGAWPDPYPVATVRELAAARRGGRDQERRGSVLRVLRPAARDRRPELRGDLGRARCATSCWAIRWAAPPTCARWAPFRPDPGVAVLRAPSGRRDGRGLGDGGAIRGPLAAGGRQAWLAGEREGGDGAARPWCRTRGLGRPRPSLEGAARAGRPADGAGRIRRPGFPDRRSGLLRR